MMLRGCPGNNRPCFVLKRGPSYVHGAPAPCQADAFRDILNKYLLSRAQSEVNSA